MKNNVFVGRIASMPMAAPSTRLQINFDVPNHRRRGIKLNNCIAKIGTRLLIPKARMNHANAPIVDGAKFIAEQALMLPNLLKKSLRRNFIRPVAKSRARMRPVSPFFVKVWREQGHTRRMRNDVALGNKKLNRAKIRDYCYGQRK
jgi:hypothetical protein